MVGSAQPQFQSTVFKFEGIVNPRLSPSEQVMFRSQGGALSSYTCFPTIPL